MTITHVYQNPKTEPVEAVYLRKLLIIITSYRFEFGLNTEDASICGLIVEIGDKKITGVVTEKQKAFDTYVCQKF